MIARILAPFGMKVAVAIIVLLLLALPLSYCKGRADGEAKGTAIVAQALDKARKADAAAHDSVTRDTALSGAEIERGRKAARDADDPWAAAVEAMR